MKINRCFLLGPKAGEDITEDIEDYIEIRTSGGEIVFSEVNAELCKVLRYYFRNIIEENEELKKKLEARKACTA